MSRPVGLFGLLAAAIGAGVWVWVAHSPQDKTETLTFTHPLVTAAPALCPWREPRRDLHAFFPQADGYQTRVISLSGLRLPIQQRLGPHATMDYNSLSVFPVFHGNAPQGAVLIQRTTGEYGVIEIVVGVDEQERVTGTRIQRLREPQEVAQALTDQAWLQAFRGKTASDAWIVGKDVPDRPAPARASAQIVARSVRSVLIEYDEARQQEKPRR